jgi:3-oxoacyl-[acyl-carrier-protein] synthase-3
MERTYDWARECQAGVSSTVVEASSVTLSRDRGIRYGSVIAGTGHSVPQRVLTNDDLTRMVDTSDEWITTRTGVKQRRIVADDENSGTLALEASRRALADARVDPSELDLIIVCTFTPEMALPSTACMLQSHLGITTKPIPAFDLSAACSGFLYGLATAHAHMQLGQYRHILVVGVETLSRMTDYTQRTTSILFGDGAGAAVLRRSDPAENNLLYTRLWGDGNGHHLIYAPGTLNPSACKDRPPGVDNYIRMDGPKVFKQAVIRMQEMVDDALTTTGLSLDDITLLVPHQANQRIIESVIDKVKFPRERVYMNIDRFGNTSAASIPIAYDEAVRSGRLHTGDIVLCIAFGAGLTWACAVVQVGPGR